jgi:NodT family efflux transporter outer membrane factor (OMF) lipoprotein
MSSVASRVIEAISRGAIPAGVALLCTACAVGPDYKRPSAAAPASFREGEGWVTAAPADNAPKGEWWSTFADSTLDDLLKHVATSNQTVAASAAAYEQARALVREQRADMFPSIDLDAGATRARSGSGAATAASTGTGTSRIGNSYQVDIGASWELDVWGRLRRSVQNARATAQASAADLANARLSAQGELASDYWQLRESDAELDLVGRTVEAYQRSLQIAQNRYDARIAAKTDLLQAQAQLYSTQSQLEGLRRQRAQLEHAIAVLVGEAPSTFSLPPAAWNMAVPDVPAVLPADLLQRRPDIAAAERRVAAANAQIGVNVAGYFPTLSLSGSGGTAGSEVSQLFNSGTYFWSVGASLAESLFNAGKTRATVAASRAAYDQTVANYRQTVLTALQDVEDQLIALRVLKRQHELRQLASTAADEAEERVLNQYREGIVGYSDVVTAQATALNDRTALIQAQRDLQTTTVALIQALGGGWDAGPR